MHPYRDPYVPPPPRVRPRELGDDRVVAGVIAVVALVRVVPALVSHEWFGTEATVALAALIFGVVGVIRGSRGV